MALAAAAAAASITDPDTTGNNNVLTVEGTDAANFEIRNSTELYFIGTSPDFETKPSYSINLKSTDGALTYNKAFTVNVTDVNEAPTNLTLSANTITENTVIGTGVKIGDITITDPDATGNNNVLTVEGTDAGNFEIRNSTELYFKGTSPDFETKPSYSINLKSTDGLLIYSKAFTVNVINVNELTPGNDISYGTSGNDIIDALDGNDRIFGQDGNDTIFLGTGADIGYGGNNNDTLYGDNGDDRLYGDAGNDYLYGGAGNDILYGGDGNDYLDGGLGNDRYYGDAGNDTFVIGSGQGLDSIYGYERNLDKILVLGSVNPVLKKSGSNLLITLGTETLATVFNVGVSDITYQLSSGN